MVPSAQSSQKDFNAYLRKAYSFYTVGFLIFIIVLGLAEWAGLPSKYIGYVFLIATILLYAGIGVMSRTADVSEYYVAGRRVPAIFNGMATGSDWMSAASFIGMAGSLYLLGYDGLAFIMGWTGGYCLVALFLAPYLRKFGQFTIPDFLGARYGGHLPRLVGVFCAIFVSFVYVVAQIYGVGLITSRFTGVAFEIGVFLGLAGILVCSFLGGMRAVTWTQVAQYIILIIAYLIPLVMLGMRHTGVPVPQIAYGYTLQKVTEREKALREDAKEKEVRDIFKARADAADARLKALPASFVEEKAKVEKVLADARANNASPAEIRAAEDAVKNFPANAEAAKTRWTADRSAANARTGPPRPHATPFPGRDDKARDIARKNFLALVFCLMVGTAALPHILMRYYTTPSVREARNSVFWSLFFICLLYFSAPALAVLVKYEIYHVLVGTKFADLPTWVKSWAAVDRTLLNITDINRDGIVQLAEIVIGGDIVVLATPEIAGLPYVISGLVAAGGLAAALSTADGLLLTIANALSHDVYYKIINPSASTKTRLAVAKFLLLVVALMAAYVASLKVADILFLVSAAFSLAAASFFPALVLGIFWKRANMWGCVTGMISGFAVTFWYMINTQVWLREVFFDIPRSAPVTNLWWDIQPISAGVFGMPVGFVVCVVVSLLTPAPSREIQNLVDHVRYPALEGDIDTRAT